MVMEVSVYLERDLHEMFDVFMLQDRHMVLLANLNFLLVLML